MEIRLTRRFPPPPGPSAQPLAANAPKVDNVDTRASANSGKAALRSAADASARGRKRSYFPFACSFTAPKYTPRGPPEKRAAGSRERAKNPALPHGAARKIHEFSIAAARAAGEKPSLSASPRRAGEDFPSPRRAQTSSSSSRRSGPPG